MDAIAAAASRVAMTQALQDKGVAIAMLKQAAAQQQDVVQMVVAATTNQAPPVDATRGRALDILA